MALFSFLFLALLQATAFLVTATCYYPDGSTAGSSYVPCAYTGVSSCCDPSYNEVCLSNGLCWYPGNYVYRGSCTDKASWASGNCTNYCQTSNSGSYQVMASCGGSTYCCGSDTACCSNQALTFDIGTPWIINDYGTPPSSTLAGTALIKTTASPTGPVSTAKGPVSSGKGSAATSSSSSISSTAGASTTAASGITTTAVIGIAVAVVALVILAAVAIGVFCCLRRKKSTQQPVSLDTLHSPPPVYAASGQAGPLPPKTADSYYQSSPVPTPASPWDPTMATGYNQSPYQTKEQSYYQEPPKTADGHYVAEVDSTPARPTQYNGKVVHELG